MGEIEYKNSQIDFFNFLKVEHISNKLIDLPKYAILLFEFLLDLSLFVRKGLSINHCFICGV